MDAEVLKLQRDSLRDALKKVLDSHEKEGKAARSLQVARENFSNDADEFRAFTDAATFASQAEREARTLLATLRD